jgi:hypothetical protein
MAVYVGVVSGATFILAVIAIAAGGADVGGAVAG